MVPGTEQFRVLAHEYCVARKNEARAHMDLLYQRWLQRGGHKHRSTAVAAASWEAAQRRAAADLRALEDWLEGDR